MIRTTRRRLVAAAAAAVLGWTGLAPAPAAAFPDRAITMLVGYRAGGQTDLVGRAAAQVMSAELGVPVNVVNKPGAGGAVAALELSKAAPDGYTVLFHASTVIDTAPFLMKRVDFSPESFEYAGLITAYQVGLATQKDAPFDDLDEFVAWAKENPGFSYGALSPASRMYMEEIARKEGLDANIVPLNGGGDMINAILGRQVVLALSGGIHYRYPDEMKMIAALTTFRHPSAPEVRTIDEFGYSLAMDSRAGLFLPKGAPREIRERFAAALGAAAEDETFARVTSTANIPIMYMDADAAEAEIARSYENNRAVFEGAGVEPR